MTPLARATLVGLLLLPGVLTVYLSFNSGGYFPGATSLAALLLALVLLLRLILAADPLRGLSVPVAVVAGLIMLFGAWTFLSAVWSDSAARALIEANRVLLYLFAVLLFGTLPRTSDRVRVAVIGLTVAIAFVCLAGFLTRTMPDVFSIASVVQDERLSHPIGYWNALGILAALGIVFSLHLTSSEREHPAARVFGAAALPLMAATLYFTFSRGAIVVALIAVLAYAVLARPHGLASGLIAAGAPTALALVASYQADLLASHEPTTAAAAAQGHDVAFVVAACAAGAAALRAACLGLDARLARVRLSATTRRGLALGAAVLVAAATVVVWTGTDATDEVEAQYDRITRPDVLQTGDRRDRLTDPGIARLDHWNVALDAFAAAPFKGEGAGTYPLLWDRDRPTYSDSQEGHSLYLEVLGELGIVGLLLLGGALLTALAALAMRARGADRHLYVALVVALLAWLIHAGVDWDWEVPAVTLALLALVAFALAAPPRTRFVNLVPSPLGRTALAVGCVALAITPALVASSQANLASSVEAFGLGDCDVAVDKAEASVDALDVRPEPYAILAYCGVRQGRPAREVVQVMNGAVERDPHFWEYRYGLALVRAAAGRDPRRAAAQALRLNPREARAHEAVRRLRGNDPQKWRKAAEKLPLGSAPRTAPPAGRRQP